MCGNLRSNQHKKLKSPEVFTSGEAMYRTGGQFPPVPDAPTRNGSKRKKTGLIEVVSYLRNRSGGST
jgi:hypothetical protein